jgi:hypothetical protein
MQVATAEWVFRRTAAHHTARPIRRGHQYPRTTMTAKEKLRAAIDELSEADAADVLD